MSSLNSCSRKGQSQLRNLRPCTKPRLPPLAGGLFALSSLVKAHKKWMSKMKGDSGCQLFSSFSFPACSVLFSPQPSSWSSLRSPSGSPSLHHWVSPSAELPESCDILCILKVLNVATWCQQKEKPSTWRHSQGSCHIGWDHSLAPQRQLCSFYLLCDINTTTLTLPTPIPTPHQHSLNRCPANNCRLAGK